MTAVTIVLTMLSGLVGLIWAGRHVKIWREQRRGFLLTADCPGPPDPAPKLSILIAARDEQANIESCVRSLLMQDYPNFEIIICDDRSEDDTGLIADSLAEHDARVRVVHIDHLPAGWKGKNHAMHKGAELADGQYLFFTDADCRQVSPRTLSVAVQLLIDRKAGLLSMLPTLEMKGFWENVIQPVCGGVMMIWFDPNRVNDPNEGDSYANGAFMLIRRDVYDRIGGHEAVKNRIQEDLEIGRLVKKNALGLTVPRSRGLYIVRMYTSAGQIVRGWTRIFFGSFVTVRRTLASIILMVVMGLAPYAAAAVGLSLMGRGEWRLACGITGAAATVIQLSVIFRFYKLIDAEKWLFWTYPLSCVIVLYILARAALKHRAGATITWKRTEYSDLR